MSMTKAEVIKEIYDGELDDSLDQIIEACRDRLKTSRKQQVHSASSGDDVRLVNLSPKYLTDYKATFVRLGKNNRAVVKLEPAAKFGRGFGRYYKEDLELTVPVTSMEVV